MLVSMTTTLWTCSINPFDKSSTKCTEDRCYRWDIWGSPNACKSCAATFLQIPVMHFFPLSAKSLYPMPGERGTKCEIFRLFLPSGRNILSAIVSSCHLSGTAVTIYFAILRPNPVPRSFPCHWSGPPVPPNSGNPPPHPGKRNKEVAPPTPRPTQPLQKRGNKEGKGTELEQIGRQLKLPSLVAPGDSDDCGIGAGSIMIRSLRHLAPLCPKLLQLHECIHIMVIIIYDYHYCQL